MNISSSIRTQNPIQRNSIQDKPVQEKPVSEHWVVWGRGDHFDSTQDLVENRADRFHGRAATYTATVKSAEEMTSGERFDKALSSAGAAAVLGAAVTLPLTYIADLGNSVAPGAIHAPTLAFAAGVPALLGLAAGVMSYFSSAGAEARIEGTLYTNDGGLRFQKNQTPSFVDLINDPEGMHGLIAK